MSETNDFFEVVEDEFILTQKKQQIFKKKSDEICNDEEDETFCDILVEHGFESCDNQRNKLEVIHKNLSKQITELRKEHKIYQTINNSLKNDLSKIETLKKELIEQQIKIRNDSNALKEECNVLSDILFEINLVPEYIEKNKQMLNKLEIFQIEMNEEIMNEKTIQEKILDSTTNEIRFEILTDSKAFNCKQCGINLCLKEDIENKSYQMGNGQFTEQKRGYLFSNAFNLLIGQTKEAKFSSGNYKIGNVKCKKCCNEIGWKYLIAENDKNKSKEGKYCLKRYELTSHSERSKK